MKRRAVLVMAGAWVALAGMPQRTSAQVGPCTGNCVEVNVVPSTQDAEPNGVVTVGLMFKQAPDSGQVGGPDKVAALALTLTLHDPSGGASDVPLQLNDCTLDADGLPAAVKPDASISNFKVVVENASCASRTHCLCPDPTSGTTPDNFVNVVIYGPNPIPTPGGVDPIVIPTLPAGPTQLLTIDLKVDGAANGTIPLHLYNQVQETQHPQFTAFLSIGDKVAVDQTCVPVTGQPPCSGSAISQVSTADGAIAVSSVVMPTPTLTPIPTVTPSCCGDAEPANGAISTAEATNAILALVNRTPELDPAAQCTTPGVVTTADATKVILNLVNRTCNP